MANIYKSNYTGAQVDDAIEKVLKAAPESGNELQKKLKEGTNITITTDGTISAAASPVTSVNGKTGAVVIDIPEGAEASNTVPKAAGTAATGTELAFARGDHVHPAQENISGNAETATKLATARTITLSGDVSGSTTFDGSGDVTITTTVVDDSHNHIIANIDGLQAALNNKASSSHNQASNTINAMIGYSKPSSTSAIATSDTLNAAIGKLEKALDNKAASSHSHSIYANQNAFSNIAVGSTTITADSTTDTLTLVAGDNITLTPEANYDRITISANVDNTNQTNGFYKYNGVITESPVVGTRYFDLYSDTNTEYPDGDAYYSFTNGQAIIDNNGVIYYVFEGNVCDCIYIPQSSGDSPVTSVNGKTGEVVLKTSDIENDRNYVTNSYHDSTKQDKLVSGTNIKTINGNSLLGSGDITISGGASSEIPVLDLGEVSSIGSLIALTSDQISWINTNYNKISAIKFNDTSAGYNDGISPLLLSNGNYREMYFYYSGIWGYNSEVYSIRFEMDNYSGAATSGFYCINKTSLGSGGSSSEPVEQETMFSGQYNNWSSGDSSAASLYLDTSSAGLTHSKIESFEFTFSLHNTYTSETETTIFQISVDDLYRMYQSGNHGMSILGGRFNLGLSTDLSLSYDKGTFNYSITIEFTPNWSELNGYDYASVSTGFTYRGFKFANGNTY